MQKKAPDRSTSPQAQQRAITKVAKQRAALNYGLTADRLDRGKKPVAAKSKATKKRSK